MTDNTVEIKFGADTGNLQAGTQQASQAVEQSIKRMDAAIKEMATTFKTNTTASSSAVNSLKDNVSQSSDSVSNSMSKINTAVNSVKSAVMGFAVFSVIKDIGQDVLKTVMSFEMLEAQLKSVTGSAEAGQAALDLVKKWAKDTPYEVEGLTKTFILLRNMGIRPTEEVMMAMTNQASKLGASQETLTAIAMQLGQAYSKGKLQQEDMVILAERGVPIYKLAAEVTGKQGAALMDMSAKGTMTRDVIDKIIVKMGEMASGSNAAAMDTLQGKISNLGDAWHQFELVLLNSKGEGVIKSMVDSVTELIQKLSNVFGSSIDQQIAKYEARIKNFETMRSLGLNTGYDILADVEALNNLLEKKRELAQKTPSDSVFGKKEADTGAGSIKAPKKVAEKSDVSEWDAELAAAKATYSAEHNLREMSKQEELKYWEEIHAKGGNTKNEELALTKKISQAKIEIARQESAEKKALSQLDINENEKSAIDNVKAKQQEVEQKLSLDQIDASQAIAIKRNLEDERYNIMLQAQLKRIELAKQDPDNPIQLRKELDQSKLLYRQHAMEVSKIETDMAKQTQVQNEKLLAPIKNAIDGSINGMIQGTLTLKGALANMGQSILAEFVRIQVQRLAKWAAAEMGMTAASSTWSAVRQALFGEEAIASVVEAKAEAAGKIPALTGIAAMGAASAVASIPYVGPALAVEAAADMDALGVSQLATASAEGGYDIPKGVNPVTQLHQNEMVLPSKYADIIRNMSGNDANPINVHINAIDAHSVRKLFMNEGSSIADALKAQARNFKVI